MAEGKYKRETALTSEEARRFSELVYQAGRRLRSLSRDEEDRKLVDELEEMQRRLWHVEWQGRPRRYAFSKLTVGEALAIREKDGETAMLLAVSDIHPSDSEETKKRILSRATFYRRLKRIRDHAEKIGVDANALEFWTDEV